MSKKKEEVKREPLEEIDLLDTMIASLVTLLEEKGILSEKEWERTVKKNVRV